MPVQTLPLQPEFLISFSVWLQMWPDLIQKAKNGGLDAIETYIFWDLHEPQRREVWIFL